MHRSNIVRGRRVTASAPWRAVAPLVVILTLATARGVTAQEAGIAVGAKAPGAKVETLDGKPTDLASFIGKRPVVLEFWATWCPLCKQLEPAMQAAREKYGDRVTFVSVGVNANQTAEKQKTYASEKQIRGELVFDRDGNAVSAYKAPHTSYIVAIDGHGKVAYTGVGPDQDVNHIVETALGNGAMSMDHGAMGKGEMGHDGMKPDGMKPDGMKPDGMKPDGMKHDGTKPAAATPSGATRTSSR